GSCAEFLPSVPPAATFHRHGTPSTSRDRGTGIARSTGVAHSGGGVVHPCASRASTPTTPTSPNHPPRTVMKALRFLVPVPAASLLLVAALLPAQTQLVRGDIDSIPQSNRFRLDCTNIQLVTSTVNLQQLHDASKQQ